MTALALVTRLSDGGTPDPAAVKPGWVALVVVLVLCVVTALLWLNMRKQLGKISFEEKENPRRRPRHEPPTEQTPGEAAQEKAQGKAQEKAQGKAEGKAP